MGGNRKKARDLLFGVSFPAEILTGIPVVEIKGDAETVVCGHRGILSYDETKICIASSLGAVTVTGEELRVFRMNRERIVLHGTIRRVSLGEEGC